MNTRDLLEEAVKILDKRGWCGLGAEGPGGTVCAMEAVRLVARHHLYPLKNAGFEHMQDATNLLEKHIPDDFVKTPDDVVPLHPVAQFNDHPSTTVEDVKLLFKRAIEDA